MAITDFKGRHAELKLLDDLWDLPTSALLILYGRRRVGKTRLLTHWLERHPERSIYWVAEPTSALDQLRSFSQAIYNFSHPESPAPPEFSYATWEQAFKELALLSRREQLAVFIDEVTYLIDVDASIVGKLQKMWDHTLKDANVLLALSGSQMGLMQRHVLSYEAPLYGRATAVLQLPPLSFDITDQFFPTYSAEERVSIYAIFGGIPAYWERLDLGASVADNIRMQLLTPNTLMQEEPRLLLQDFVNDLYNYVSILRAIAQGAHTQSGIGRRTGLSIGHVSKYLGVLRDTSFVERQVPATELREKSRRGRYFITDPYLRFYYRFLATTQSQLAMRAQQKSLESIIAGMPQFIESNTWNELCREWLISAGAHGELPFEPENVGGTWTRTQEIDVAAINYAAKKLILGNCYWRNAPMDYSGLQELMRKTNALIPKKEEWEVYFIGFASNGWAPDAIAMANTIALQGESGSRWHSAGIQLLDLERIDGDLSHWATSPNGSGRPLVQGRLFTGAVYQQR